VNEARRLTATDARAMAALHTESFERPWDALEMAAHIQKDMCLGVDYDGSLAGFIILSVAAGQAEILTLTTASAARRQGLAQSLISGVELELQKRAISELFLEVAEDNSAAIALYQSVGFTPIGRRPGYYRRTAGRIAALTFSKKLSKNP